MESSGVVLTPISRKHIRNDCILRGSGFELRSQVSPHLGFVLCLHLRSINYEQMILSLEVHPQPIEG